MIQFICFSYCDPNVYYMINQTAGPAMIGEKSGSIVKQEKSFNLGRLN